MADRELIIKMSEEVYKSIINGKNYISYQGYIEEAIKNGTTLPKGHGRLGDLDELTQRITNYIEHNEHMMDELTLLQEKFILEGIKETPTIIEADREQEVGRTIDEIKKDMCFAQMVIGVIDNVKRPMLVYDEEKEVVKKALQKYLDELESELWGK